MAAASDSKGSGAGPASVASTDVQALPSRGSSTAVQAAPFPKSVPARTTTPPKSRFNPERVAAEIARFDRALVGILLLLAFLLSSFVARNTNVWMHLANGRTIVQELKQGKLPEFGGAPFAQTTGQGPWVYHAWLYDVVLYGVSTLFGGPESTIGAAVLIVLKALLIMLLAWLMVSIRRPGQSLWTPVLCVGLALLVLSLRVSLSSEILSFLFLGATLYLLQPPGATAASRADASGRRLWLLPLLFIIWVNVDQWFILGPLTVGLFLLGEGIQQVLAPVQAGADRPRPGRLPQVGLVFVAGLFACLVNPYHYHAFTLPRGLNPGDLAGALGQDTLFQPLLHSPLPKLSLSPFRVEWGDYFQPSFGLNPIGLAYYPLLALGVVSFAVNLAGWRWWRALIWLVFCALSLYHARMVPFFAVVAGPIAALNFQDWAIAKGWQPVAGPGQARRALLGRGLTLLLGIGLLAAAWPGWLGPNFNSPQIARRAGWGVAVDPSLKQAADWLSEQHHAGRIPANARGINLTAEVGDYCRWFCPEEKGLFDSRVQLFPEAARDFLTVRRTLPLEVLKPAPDGSEAEWQGIFRRQGIHHLVLSQPFGIEAHPLVVKAVYAPEEWVVLSTCGRAVIMGWQDPKQTTDAFKELRLDMDQRAFCPNPNPEDRAPAAGPSRLAEKPSLLKQFLVGPALKTPDEYVSRLYVNYFLISLDARQQQLRRLWSFCTAAGIIGTSCQGPGLIGMLSKCGPTDKPNESPPLFPIRYSGLLLAVFSGTQDQGESAAPLLAVRAARRAIAANPDDATAYLALAQATTQLWLAQEDHWAAVPPRAQLSPRQHLRVLQVITAAHQALRLEPKAVEAHRVLYERYRKMNFWDLATEHLRAAVELTRAAGPRPNEDKRDFALRLKAYEDELETTERQFRNRSDEYELQAANKPVLQKAEDAIGPQYGLARPALKALEGSDISLFGAKGALMELTLMLVVGRLEEVRQMLTETDPNEQDPARKGMPVVLDRLDPRTYYWLLAQVEACAGNYEKAGQALDQLIEFWDRKSTADAVEMVRWHAFAGIGLDRFFRWSRETGPDYIRNVVENQVLRGLLALEAGDNQVAAKHFRSVLNVDRTPEQPGMPLPARGSGFVFEGRPIAAHYLKALEKYQDTDPKKP